MHVMPSIQIKNVPPETHAVLRQRAAAAHQSLQEYLLSHLEEFTREPTMAEILDRVAASESGGRATFEDTVAFLREDRESH